MIMKRINKATSAWSTAAWSRNASRAGAAFAVSLLLPAAASAGCALQFAIAGGQLYSIAQYTQFIDTEVRPELSQTAGSFEIDLTKTCDNGQTTTVQIEVDKTNYYLTDIEGHHLSTEESRYQTSALMLSADNIDTEVDRAATIGSLSTAQIQDVVKALAFILAEAARFTSVESLSNSILSSDCSLQWLDYATLVRRWSVLSRFALHTGPNDWSVQGGSGGHLVAPITASEVASYDAAVQAGPNGPNAASVDHADWGAPISVAPATCAAGPS